MQSAGAQCLMSRTILNSPSQHFKPQMFSSSVNSLVHFFTGKWQKDAAFWLFILLALVGSVLSFDMLKWVCDLGQIINLPELQ